MLDVATFEIVRTEICASGPSSDGDNLLGMEIDASVYLDPGSTEGLPNLWQGFTVRREEGAPWLIQGRAHGRRADATQICAELSRVWEQKLRYSYRSAHTISTTADAVTLQAVTQIGPADFWVTAQVEVGLS